MRSSPMIRSTSGILTWERDGLSHDKGKSNTSEPTGACIFCGSSDLSREHVWADWLKKYIKKDALNHSRMDATLHPTISEYERKKVSGDLRSHRLNVVWFLQFWMDEQTTKSSEALSGALLKGEIVSIDAAAQEIISAWITMFVMVAEYFNPYKVSTSQEQRRRFFDDQKCPVNWKIWIGGFVGKIGRGFSCISRCRSHRLSTFLRRWITACLAPIRKR